MKQLALLLIVPAVSFAGDLSLEVGLGVHSRGADYPEVQMNNPLGIVEVGYELDKRTRIVVNHTSSIRDYEAGYGMNSVQLRFKLK